MGTSLSLSQQLKLQAKLSPSQIQLMKMLEIPSCELQARINEELQDNPALEEGEPADSFSEDGYETGYQEDEPYENPLQNEDFNYDDYVNDDATDYTPPSGSPNAARAEDIPFSVATGLQDYLKSQVYLTSLNKEERHIAKFVVGNIDDDGYLRRTAESLVDDIAFRDQIIVTDETMKTIIKQVQTFDPAGVGASNLQECLLLQLLRMEPTPTVRQAIKIVQNAFSALSRRDYTSISNRFDLSKDEIRDIMQVITHLNPKPGNIFGNSLMERNQQVVIPDFTIENRDGKLVVLLHEDEIPELHISPKYTAMLEQYSTQKNAETKEAARFVKSKIESAQSFIYSIRQRSTTLMHTMQAIVEFQTDFFLTGDQSALRPMVLKDIADKTKLDLSTISRVSNSKYVQTEYGTFPLKFFFSEVVISKQGVGVSNREIKTLLQELIQNEDKTNPLSDDALCAMLRTHHYDVARRTVAKYREALGLPVARLRRQM